VLPELGPIALDSGSGQIDEDAVVAQLHEHSHLAQGGVAESLLMEAGVEQTGMVVRLPPGVVLHLALGVDTHPVGVVLQVPGLAVDGLRPLGVHLAALADLHGGVEQAGVGDVVQQADAGLVATV